MGNTAAETESMDQLAQTVPESNTTGKGKDLFPDFSAPPLSVEIPRRPPHLSEMPLQSPFLTPNNYDPKCGIGLLRLNAVARCPPLRPGPQSFAPPSECGRAPAPKAPTG
jgi:hypothetical protein